MMMNDDRFLMTGQAMAVIMMMWKLSRIDIFDSFAQLVYTIQLVFINY